MAGTLYDVLGVQSSAKDVEIRRAFRNLVTRVHPDKGGDATKFRAIQQAYEILSDRDKRTHYDATGEVIKSVEDAFADSFAGGTFRDVGRASEVAAAGEPALADQIAVRSGREAASHSAGFDAWMRARGTGGVSVFTSDDVVDRYGVAKGSYDATPLPEGVRTFEVTARPPLGSEPATESRPLPSALEWGQVLLAIRAAPVTMGDLYTLATGGRYGDERAPGGLPFVPGHDAAGVVAAVGPGVKGLSEGDWVVPAKPLLGTWRSMLVAREKDLRRVPRDIMPFEQLALLREMTAAYRLLEDAPGLKPGDCVAINAATGAVGQFAIQLASLLRLRVVAVASPPGPAADGGAGGAGGAGGRGKAGGGGKVATGGAPDAEAAGEGGAGGAGGDAGEGGAGRAGEDAAAAAAAGTGAAAAESSRPDSDSASTAEWERTERWLRELGATVVLKDAGSLRASLDRLRFFARPKLALDGVGGASSARLADCLEDAGQLSVFGCASGRAPAIDWRAYVFRGIVVKGFNARAFAEKSPARYDKVVEELGNLVRAGKLASEVTEYDLATEAGEAIEHARARGRHTRVILKAESVGMLEARP